MKNKLDATQIWKQFEYIAPRLRLNIVDRAVYSHLPRHCKAVGREGAAAVSIPGWRERRGHKQTGVLLGPPAGGARSFAPGRTE
jgi:hypothetical protein